MGNNGVWHAPLVVVVCAGMALQGCVRDNDPSCVFTGDPLLRAVTEGDADLVRALLDEGRGVDSHTILDDTLLIIAAGSGHLDLVRLLLDRGANVRAQNSLGTTAVHAASYGGHAEVTRLLLERGGEVDGGNLGLTPLHLAASPDVVEVLVGAGALINKLDDRGRTPLRLAMLGGRNEVAAALRKHGAVDMQSEVGRVEPSDPHAR